MASRGSVILLFIQQIKEEKPITITNPEMTRLRMSLKQVVDYTCLYLKMVQGDIFVQKAPAATIETLAESIRDILNKKSKNYYETWRKII